MHNRAGEFLSLDFFFSENREKDIGVGILEFDYANSLQCCVGCAKINHQEKGSKRFYDQ